MFTKVHRATFWASSTVFNYVLCENWFNPIWYFFSCDFVFGRQQQRDQSEAMQEISRADEQHMNEMKKSLSRVARMQSLLNIIITCMYLLKRWEHWRDGSLFWSDKQTHTPRIEFCSLCDDGVLCVQPKPICIFGSISQIKLWLSFSAYLQKYIWCVCAWCLRALPSLFFLSQISVLDIIMFD